MKTRLDQLTLHDLIELSCGDTKVLLEEGENPAESVLMSCARQIMTEYKETASPAQAKMDMMEGEELQKLRMKEKCLRICLALVSQLRADMARDVLLELDVNGELLKSDGDIVARCKAMLDDVQYEINRHTEMASERAQKSQTPSEMRKAWYGEIAFVMSTLKMNLDPGTANAAVYGHLVRQAVERNKQLAKMPAMMSMLM